MPTRTPEEQKQYRREISRRHYQRHLEEERARNRNREKEKYHADIEAGRLKGRETQQRRVKKWKAYNKKRYWENPELFRSKVKEAYHANPEPRRQYSKKYREEHKSDPLYIETKRAQDKAYYAREKEALKAKARAYYVAHHDEMRRAAVEDRENAKVDLVCIVCGVVFHAQKDRQTCGRICQGEWLRRRNVEYLTNGKYNNGYSSIEVLMRDALIKLQLFDGYFKDIGEGSGKFVAQYLVRGSDGTPRYTVDFACPSKKVALECDGEYWHARNVPREQQNTMQRRMVANDRHKEKYLFNHGWKLYRFWESEIVKDAKQCVAEIKDLTNA